MTTVFGIGIAALASCQPFRESAHGVHTAIEEFAEFDDCMNQGGSWSIDRHRCDQGIDAVIDGGATGD